MRERVLAGRFWCCRRCRRCLLPSLPPLLRHCRCCRRRRSSRFACLQSSMAPVGTLRPCAALVLHPCLCLLRCLLLRRCLLGRGPPLAPTAADGSAALHALLCLCLYRSLHCTALLHCGRRSGRLRRQGGGLHALRCRLLCRQRGGQPDWQGGLVEDVSREAAAAACMRQGGWRGGRKQSQQSPSWEAGSQQSPR